MGSATSANRKSFCEADTKEIVLLVTRAFEQLGVYPNMLQLRITIKILKKMYCEQLEAYKKT
jgi:hypothetical protein